ncbi:MAG: glycerophosphodiester phosphodiesterase [Gammaproteobacteria bacterium]|nr:glycerophosphodiester phosphodiesterase [Gammaproteobacteria bacterium]
MQRKTEIYAHRGGAGLFPENTLPAYRHALELGVDVLDLDVAITKDDVIVASHDLFLNCDFTCDKDSKWLADNTLLIQNFTFAELQQYDVGSLDRSKPYAAFYPDQQSIAGTRIPSVQQVIDLGREYYGDKLRLQIEIKTDPTQPMYGATPEHFMRVLNKLLQDNHMAEHSEVHSFDWRNMLALQAMKSRAITSYITSSKEAKLTPETLIQWHGGYDIADYNNSYPELIAAIGGKIWCPDFHDVTKENVAQAHELGLRVTTWTPNKLEDMQRLIAAGVDGLITDYPDRLKAIL